MKMRPLLWILLFFAFFVASCQPAGNKATDGKLQLVATIFPIYDFAKQIGGDHVSVTLLMPPGADAHHYELRPDDILRISRADLFLFTHFEMEHWAYKIIQATAEHANMTAVETGHNAMLLPLSSDHVHHPDSRNHPAGHQQKHAHPHENSHDHLVDDETQRFPSPEDEPSNKGSRFDPHIWLDFDNAAKMIDNITTALIQKDTRHSDTYKRNAKDYKRRLAALDAEYRAQLASCKHKTILHAGHWAFAYLANRYDLNYVAAYSASAEAEPSPKAIVGMIDQIRAQKLSHIYYEERIAPRLAQTLARETGVELLKIRNGHDVLRADIDAGATFISVMQDNLVELKKGLQCP